MGVDFNTGTLAPLMNRGNFSEAEQIVLNHFFTNLDRNVYAATPNMSSQLWAFFTGQYSRSHLSMRDRFLQILEDMKSTYDKGKLKSEDLVTVEDLAKDIQSGGGLRLGFFEQKASAFLKKWGIEYGHDSLKDADTVRFAIEGISQLATTPIETPDPNLGAYQEKSSRYISFDKQSVIIPPTLKNSGFSLEVKLNNDALMDSYSRNFEVVLNFIKTVVMNRNDFESDGAFEKTARAKTLDIVRYWLPQGLITSLGATWSSRIAEIHISYLLSHQLEELRLIGQSLLEEGVKVSPTLLTHVGENQYVKETIPSIDRLTMELLGKPEIIYHRGEEGLQRVKLISSTPNLENKLVAAILFENGNHNLSFEEIEERVNSFSIEEKGRVYHEYLNRRGSRDLMMRAIRVGNLIFDVVHDNGGWRDLKRQRVGLMLKQKITAAIGYAYPEFLQDAEELSEIKLEYEKLMERTSELFLRVEKEFSNEASYIPAMGNWGRSIYQFDPRQGQYHTELRTPPTNHQSNRTIFQQMYEKMSEVLPILCRYIKVNYEDASVGRKEAEEKTERKRRELSK